MDKYIKESEILIQAKGLCKSFDDIHILKDADFKILKGETVGVTGASGTGKSTFLHILGALDRPNKGEILFNGKLLFSLSKNSLAKLRNRSIGFVFQFHHLLAEFTAIENVMMPALIAGEKRKVAMDMAKAALEKVILNHRLYHKVTKLSGGEQQRVALARALVMRPSILLADEPTGNLDKKNSTLIHDMLIRLNIELNMTMVIVTHNQELAKGMSKVVTISDGKIV